jgi:hypothetical protein
VTFTNAAGVRVKMAELVAHDGRAFRDTSNPTGPSRPVAEVIGTGPNPFLTDLLEFGAAERYDMLLRPPGPGTFQAKFQWFNWITKKVIATRNVPLIVS